jgi:membrane-bound inhibitor of C-type lysozyme
LRVPVIYENAKHRAVVTYAGKSWYLPQVPSADGARYMNAKLEWWEKGPTATLSSVTDGKPDTVLTTCTAIKVKKT